MISDEAGKKLHDRAARGETLSSEDHSRLKMWYKNQDDAESESLNLHTDMKSEMILQKEIDSVLSGIRAVNDEIDKLSNENKMLKNNIFEIQQRLADKTDAHAV